MSLLQDEDLAFLEAAPLLFRSMDVFVAAASLPQDEAPRVDPEAIAHAARQQGVLDGVRQTEVQMQEIVRQERLGVSRALEEFVREKQRYFAGLEREVARLSLAIAERVLHREATMDPHLLAGAARVALEQVEDEHEAVLRVAPEDKGTWSDMMQHEDRRVQVTPDPSLKRGECLLQTPCGTVELGIKAQLQEIEQGFFELLNRNPALAG